MNTSDFFALQLDNQADICAFSSLEINLRCLRGENGLNLKLAEIERNFPERKKSYESPWYKALIAAIKPFYHIGDDSGKDNYTHPLSEFLKAQMSVLNGSSMPLLGRLTPNLGRFTESQLTQPHMQWLTMYTERLAQLKSDYPELKSAVRLARVHPIKGLSDEKLIVLDREFIDGSYCCSMDYTDYVNWYAESCDMFIDENKQLTPDVEARVLKTLCAWSKTSSDQESDVYYLCRNYNFHPQHEGFVKELVAKNPCLVGSS